VLRLDGVSHFFEKKGLIYGSVFAIFLGLVECVGMWGVCFVGPFAQ
jgi:hypothetical protein